MKKKIILICSFVLLLTATFTGTFFLYVETVKNPKTIEITPEDIASFRESTQDRYPVPLLSELPYEDDFMELNLSCGAAILIDAETGSILYEKNADRVIPPASMTKLVVMYVVFQEIATGAISLDDIVPLPPESWAVNAPPASSLMFLGEGQTVTLRELLLGLAVASGNDAAVAVAHYVSGSVDSFIERMNLEMKKLGLEKTHFVEPSGYSELNVTTPREFATFARQYILRYPEALRDYHSQLSISYPQEKNLPSWQIGKEHPIYQQNTNKLLGLMEGCDGLKTGFIYESGYNLSLTVKRGDTRFISVTMQGAGSGSAEGNDYRIKDSTTLMEWAFANYKTCYMEDISPITVPVLGGNKNAVALVPLHNRPLTIPDIVTEGNPADTESSLTYRVSVPSYLWGGFKAGDTVGTLEYMVGDKVLESVPIVAYSTVEEKQGLKKIVDSLVAKLF